MEVSLLPYQGVFITSTLKKLLLLGGIGTGKSFSLAHTAVNLVGKHKGINILMVANTYTQLMNATVKALTNELDACNIPYKAVLSGAKKRIEILNSTIYLYSLEKPDNIRGIEVGALLMDEVAYSDEYAYKVCVGRLRQKGMPLCIRIASSPNGHNWLYDMFGESCIKAKTCDNFFLPPEYYEELLELYGGPESPLAKQELFGEFVNLSGLNAYWAFNRDIHTSHIKHDPRRPVYIGVDFNIDNMNAAVMQQDHNGNWRMIEHIKCGEYDSNTFSLGDKIVEWLIRNKCQFHTVIPDSTGGARKTSANKTDIQILKDKGLKVEYNHNPIIRDRQNNVNRLFKLNKLVVNSECKEFVKELEVLSKADKEGEKAHATVAMGYVLWKYAPMKKRQTGLRELSI